jgi:hypothetical protein
MDNNNLAGMQPPPVVKLADTSRDQYYDIYNALYLVGKVLTLEIEGKQRPVCSIGRGIGEYRVSVVWLEALVSHPFRLARDCLMEVILTPEQLAELVRQSRDPETLRKYKELVREGNERSRQYKASQDKSKQNDL